MANPSSCLSQLLSLCLIHQEQLVGLGEGDACQDTDAGGQGQHQTNHHTREVHRCHRVQNY